VDLVDEEHLAGHQARQQRGEVAGVLDRGPLDSRSGRSLSCATIIASVVLPSPAARTAGCGPAALLDARRIEQQLQLSAHLLLADELGEDAGRSAPSTASSVSSSATAGRESDTGALRRAGPAGRGRA
jgi:hypothetical protein